mgnify:CR=1 FL=1
MLASQARATYGPQRYQALEQQFGDSLFTPMDMIDMAINNSGQFLYALNAGTHTVSMFQMQADGGLVSLGEIAVPAGAVGLAAH